MLKNLSYHQLNVILQLGSFCPYLELKYLAPLGKEVSKHVRCNTDGGVLLSDILKWLENNKPKTTFNSWYDILTKADYEMLKVYLIEEFND